MVKSKELLPLLSAILAFYILFKENLFSVGFAGHVLDSKILEPDPGKIVRCAWKIGTLNNNSLEV